MRIPALLAICLLMAGLAYAQLPTMAPTPLPKHTVPMPLMSEEEKHFKGGMSPTPIPTPPPKGWQTAHPTVSGPNPANKMPPKR